MSNRVTALLGFAACLVACGSAPKGPDPVREMEVALGAAAALGLSVDIAMNAMSSSSACATVDTDCATFPCDGTVTVNLGSACPLPLGGEGTGSVSVSGSWSSADAATLSSTFTSTQAGGRNLVVASATVLTVRRSGAEVDVTYVGQDVEARGETAVADQSSWTVSIDTAGTPEDPSDDTFTITGTKQAASQTGSSQLTVTDVVLDPSCRKNPVSGRAIIQDASTTSINQQMIEFHAACDGKADSGFGGTSQIDLDFFE